MTAPILELEGLTRRFGGLVAVNALTMAVRPRTIHGVIGPNGAGKSTAFDLISGLTAPSAGSIRLEGRDVTGLSVEGRSKAGSPPDSAGLSKRRAYSRTCRCSRPQ
jgi:branched-chain amino acid transport system ATP-binding protein